MKKIVIWFIGSNGTGKTTQSKNLLYAYQDYKYKVIGEKDKFFYTKTGRIAGLGTFSDKDCCGCDTLRNKAMIRQSYLKAIDDKEVTCVVIDGIMSTNTWIEFIRERDVLLLVVHFEIDIENNLLRVLNRRGVTDLDNYPMEKISGLQDNLNGKIKGFKKQYETQIANADSNISIPFGLHQSQVHNLILEKINELQSENF